MQNYKLADWQHELKQLISDPIELLELLKINPAQVPEQLKIDFNNQFKLRVPRSYVSKIQAGNISDPLLLQILPQIAEENFNSSLSHEYGIDPLQEKTPKINPQKSILHKFQRQVLIILSPSCAINCRYCFRRHYPYSKNYSSQNQWGEIFSYLKQHPEVTEVILSGGDPLIHSDEYLGNFLKILNKIEHIKILRFHTRLPVVIPNRIQDDFIQATNNFTKAKVMVFHINHYQEICEKIKNQTKLLKQNDFTVLNQSVLLKNVNDCPRILEQLSFKLFAAGIIPYYLHLLDKVQGAEHFDLELHKSKSIYTELAKSLPGYLLPKLVRETPLLPYKEIINL